jgi:UDP-N-acetylglucosamine--N-acetylmuramyl-(pentapeptide) pyrophosphoryl-undecaprenol N-acetylglucosamine transferase
MRIIFSGGGTGGHVYPALALAEKLREREPDVSIAFIGTEDGMENSILTNYDYDFFSVKVSAFSRKPSVEIIKTLCRAFSGLKEARRLIKKLCPDIIVGTGGYVCGPVVLAGYLCGVKTCIQEQNAMPGLTNRILAGFVDKIFLGSPAAAKYFSRKSKVVISGNPIRAGIMAADHRLAQDILDLDPGKKTLLVSGGSRGAMSINQAMLCVHEKLAGSSAIQVLHITGEKGFEAFAGQLPAKVRAAENLKILPYMNDMPLALAAADLAVFRAGAIGLSELAARGVPSILVPYPYATANHQEHNARAFERENAAIVVRDRELTGDSLNSLINILLNDEDRLSGMAQAARKLGRPEAADRIVQEILDLAKR